MQLHDLGLQGEYFLVFEVWYHGFRENWSSRCGCLREGVEEFVKKVNEGELLPEYSDIFLLE